MMCQPRHIVILLYFAAMARHVRVQSFVVPLTTIARTTAGPSRRHHEETHAISVCKSSTSTTLAASPSGIDELPTFLQAGAFFGTYAALGIITYPATKVLESVSKSVGLEKWRDSVIDTSLPLILGMLYVSAGIGHFVNAQAFCDIYPPRGTWGVWYLPGSAQFHVAWTGAVEALGGAGLIFGGMKSLLGSEADDEDDNLAVNLIKPACALVLFVLTVVVTPANIYMWTHGATMGPDMGELTVSFHYARFAVQVALLSQGLFLLCLGR
mmetsp:Transcript_22650/g.49171  ORF Transcript_22650/g.49171 Transcript_22650/m.49171 type:complete len:268 (-) Transcript_22650:160-963(-)